MTRYLVLLRGINVGGRNKVPMAALRDLLESHGHTKVSTYIASGNVILSSDQSAAGIKRELEEALPKTFKLDSELIAVLVLTLAQLRAIVRDRPKGFGDKPDTYHSDAVFLMGTDAATAMKVFDPRPGVDEVWPGKGVIYSQRLSAQRTKSRLGKIVGTPAYKSMTIRSWQTTLALLERMEAPEDDRLTAPLRARLVDPDDVAPRVGELEPPSTGVLVQLHDDPAAGGQDARERCVDVVGSGQCHDAVTSTRGGDAVQSPELLAGPRRVLDPCVVGAVVVEHPAKRLPVEGLCLLDVVDRELHVVDHLGHGFTSSLRVVAGVVGAVIPPRCRTSPARPVGRSGS